jgi:hypothetical protein
MIANILYTLNLWFPREGSREFPNVDPDYNYEPERNEEPGKHICNFFPRPTIWLASQTWTAGAGKLARIILRSKPVGRY